MIQVDGLSKHFGATRAVRGVSFSVEHGQVVGLLGPNGAGKTTTMRMLACFMPADEGTATIAGYDIRSHSLEVRQSLGYLPESAPLYEEMGVIAYLSFIAEVRGLAGSARRRRIDAMTEICGLEGVVKKDIGELSKGYRQRVGLAQALIHDPPILILDEPTSGLDPKQIIEIRELIKEIGREKTVILSTHILPEVTATCSRVLIIHNGRLVADGSPSELSDRSGSGARIFLTIRAARDQVNEALARNGRLLSYRELSEPGPGLVRYELRSEDGVTACETLFRMGAENGWPISEIHEEVSSLEDVFIELTRSEALTGTPAAKDREPLPVAAE